MTRNVINTLKQLIISVEDRRYYYHYGIDPIAILRALIINLKAGRYVQGGSTITQQLARTLFLDNRKTLSRKIKEVFLAFYLEYRYSKDKILDMYINSIYLGPGVKGFKRASRKYFNKSLKDTTNKEQLSLVVALKSPKKYKPGSDSNRRRMKLYELY